MLMLERTEEVDRLIADFAREVLAGPRSQSRPEAVGGTG
jgi:hypothetical protein